MGDQGNQRQCGRAAILFETNNEGSRPPTQEEAMNARRNAVRLGIATMLFTLVGVLPAGLASAQQKMVLKASDVHPLGYPTVEAVENMGKKLEKATNGRLSVQMYASMQLGGEKEAVEQAQ